MPKSSPKEFKGPTLVGLASEYSAIAAEIISFGGELTPEMEAKLDAVLSALVAKADGYGMVLDQLAAQVGFWKLQKDKCAESQAVAENAIERLRDRMKFVLGQTDGEALQGDLYRFYLAKTAPKLIIDDAALPAKYRKTEVVVSADRTAIKTALDAGETVEGVTVQENKALRTGRPK